MIEGRRPRIRLAVRLRRAGGPTAAAERLIGVAWLSPVRTRSPRGAAGEDPTRCRPAPTCTARSSPARPPGARLSPVPRADGRQQCRVRRPAGVQQLRLLRELRLPDRRQGRPGRTLTARARHRTLRDPARELRQRDRARPDRPPGPCRALPRRGRRPVRAHRVERDPRVRRVRDTPTPAAQRCRQLVGSRRPVPHVSLPDLRDRLVRPLVARPPRTRSPTSTTIT